MHRRTVVITSMLGASGVAICVPDIKAYRRLAAVARSVRADMPATVTGQVSTTEGMDRVGHHEAGPE